MVLTDDETGVIHVRKPHPYQKDIIDCMAKRIIVKAGRRFGKTLAMARRGIKKFNQGKRVLYAAPTSDQTDVYWWEVTRALAEPIQDGALYKNETERVIEVPGTKQRIRAKTAWHPDHIRGDYADELQLDEWQLQNEDVWDRVGAPMLADTDGDAVFIYAPPSLYASGQSKARDPRHASKMFRKALNDPEWATFHFSSHENPYISQDALARIAKDMSLTAYRQEILAIDDDAEDSWLIYGTFRQDICIVPRFEIDKSWPRYVGHDFGLANPAALFGAQDPASGQVFLYHEYLPGGGRSAYEHVQEFKRIAADATILRRLGGSHQEDEIRQAYTAQGWHIEEPRLPASGTEQVKAGIERVRSLIGNNRIYIFNDMKATIEEISNYLWEIDAEGRPIEGKIKDKHRFHMMDCLRYMCSVFKPELAETEVKFRGKRWP